MTDQAIENIKRETIAFHKTDEQKAMLQEKIEKFKSEILEDYKKFKISYPDKSFSNYKEVAFSELQSGNVDGHPLLMNLGVYLNAFDQIKEDDLI